MPDIASLTIAFRGAGDVASGAALRLYNAGLRRIILLETARPMKEKSWLKASGPGWPHLRRKFLPSGRKRLFPSL